jgi:Rrf2 family protein
MAELARHYDSGAVKAEDIADAQDIPLNFLLGILRELRNGQLVRSVRGREGGYLLSRPPAQIALADVIRVVDGPLANVRDMSLSQLSYPGAAAALRDVWMAVRGSLREVLENVSVGDLASGKLPKNVRLLAERHQAERF